MEPTERWWCSSCGNPGPSAAAAAAARTFVVDVAAVLFSVQTACALATATATETTTTMMAKWRYSGSNTTTACTTGQSTATRAIPTRTTLNGEEMIFFCGADKGSYSFRYIHYFFVGGGGGIYRSCVSALQFSSLVVAYSLLAAAIVTSYNCRSELVRSGNSWIRAMTAIDWLRKVHNIRY
jgi:hypothetical protein